MSTENVNAQALPSGTLLNEFEVEEVLGSGGFGITYLARDVNLGRKVVIKENLPAQFAFRDPNSLTVSPRQTRGEDADNFAWSLKNFSQEASILASLDHPGIVPVMQSFEAFGTSYFVMPHVEGEALDVLTSRRKEDPYGDDELRGLLEHVLDALGYLHGKKIYHRDIKPGNILITKGGVAILIDFGSARQRLSERSMTVVESAGYTPFEQLESRGNVGPWSDLYALGATVSKAITGEAPPKATDRMRQDPYMWLGSRPELQGQYSGVLLGSIDRALAVEESARWQDAGQWLGALQGEQLASGEDESVPPVPEAESEASSGEALGDPAEASATGQLKEDDAERHLKIAEMYATGSGRAKNEAEAVKWYRKAAKQGDAVAQYNLGWRYANGRGVAKDEAEAVKWYHRAAEQGDANAQNNLGLRYEKGRGVTKHEEEAVNWYRKAAKQGDAMGQFCLGLMYADGRGVEQDEAEAVNWYRKAAKQGDATGQFYLGWMYANGRGVEQDEAEAVNWYLEAAAQDLSPAQFCLGLMYADGRGVEQDEAEAVNWYRKAAKQGDATAQYKLGWMYKKGRGVAKNEVEAVNWFHKAAEQGHAEAQTKLAWMHDFGRGVGKDKTEAVKWYRKAADQGNRRAQRNLGISYETQEGVADDAEAVKWYREAALQDDGYAQYKLGWMYANGRGVEKR